MEEEIKTIPAEMITDEMRETGVDESTPLMTRDEVVAEVGEGNMPDTEISAEEVTEESEPESA